MTEHKGQHNELILKENFNNSKNQLVVKSDQNASIVRSNLYNTDLVEYGIYKNFNYVDISTISNLSKKFILYNLPDVNDDEIKDFIITLLNKLSPNINTSKSLNPIISFDKRDSGEYYIIEVERHEQVIIMKNLDGIEWLNHRIRIDSPKEFFRDYNDTKGQIAMRQKINESKLFSNLAQENLNKNTDNNKNNFNRLLMTGLPINIEEKEAKDIVESYGQVKYFNLVNKTNDNDISYTLCFFEYESPQNTYKALKGLNNMTIGDKQLKVQRINNQNQNNEINEESYTMKNATIASVTKSLIKVDSIDNQTLPKEGGVAVVHITCKGQGVSLPEIPEEAKSWLSYSSTRSYEGGATVSFKATPNEGGARSATVTFRTTDGEKEYTSEATINQNGGIVVATLSEFRAAEVGDTQYRFTGIISKLDGKGNFYVTDYSGCCQKCGLRTGRT